MLIRRATTLDGWCCDLRCDAGRIVALSGSLEPLAEEQVIEAGGGVILPGLHDHHLHLFATAAAMASVPCGPPEVNNAGQLAAALRGASPTSSWLRGVGYHESVAGLPGRVQLDTFVGDRPLRMQHRSGKMWLLNSAAVAELGLDELDHQARAATAAGIERDALGRATGRLFRMDDWLGKRLRHVGGRAGRPELTEMSRQLARCGVTGVTDAGASNDDGTVEAFAKARCKGQLLQNVLVMGGQSLSATDDPDLQRGAYKVLLDDHQLPDFDQLVAGIGRAHGGERAVAIHCVTQVELVFALGALAAAGHRAGDRIEHASVVPDDIIPLMREAGVAVVTQPGFIYQRGDRYRRDVIPRELQILYRARCLLEAGVPLAGSSDAPYGDLDPWLAMRAAVHRRSRDGHLIAAGEALRPEQALALYTCAAGHPGGQSRRLEVGAVADLCLLGVPWLEARDRLCAADVRATIIRGELVYSRGW